MWVLWLMNSQRCLGVFWLGPLSLLPSISWGGKWESLFRHRLIVPACGAHLVNLLGQFVASNLMRHYWVQSGWTVETFSTNLWGSLWPLVAMVDDWIGMRKCLLDDTRRSFQYNLIIITIESRACRSNGWNKSFYPLIPWSVIIWLWSSNEDNQLS